MIKKKEKEEWDLEKEGERRKWSRKRTRKWFIKGRRKKKVIEKKKKNEESNWKNEKLESD